MKVLVVPARLRLATAALLCSIPLAAIEKWLSFRGFWRALNWAGVLTHAGVVAVFCLPLAWAVARGHRSALSGVGISASIWVMACVVQAIQGGNTALLFFAFFLALFLGAVAFWLEYETSRSFLNPGIRWYQSLPKPIPGLRCQLVWGAQKLDLKVGRLDDEGAFLFSDRARDLAGLGGSARNLKADLTLFFRDRQVRCGGLPVSLLKSGAGAGFKFEGLLPDSRKELGDFVETLRGEGYVL